MQPPASALLLIVLAIACPSVKAQMTMTTPETQIVYPESPKSQQVDTYHGVLVPDPYRWLEEPDSPETRKWVEEQNKVTFGYIAKLPHREKIRERLLHLWNYEKYGLPWRKGGRYFFSKNDGLQNQAVLYTARSLDETPRVLIDPNTLSDDGTISLAGTGISEDGRWMAYGLSQSGSDWTEWRVRNVETGEDTKDHLKWVKFSGAEWTHDNAGFFYNRYDEPEKGREYAGANVFQKLYYHRLGEPQSKDTLIYENREHPDWMLGCGVTEDGRYLVLSISHAKDINNAVFYRDLQDTDGEFIPLLPDFDATYAFIGNTGSLFYFVTDKGAPKRRVVCVDLTKPQPVHWTEIIPAAKDTLTGVSFVHDTFIAQYLRDARSVVVFYRPDGSREKELPLPGLGDAGGFGGKREDDETFYSFTGFQTPSTIYRYDFKTGKSEVFRKPEVDFRPDDFEAKQVFYHSKDGTRVPMFIAHRKGLKLDGTNPTILYGYGGFNASLQPFFSVSNLVWMELGGVFAMPNLRGGGEYGEEWHKAGMQLTKQNTFDDFIAAAEWLIENRYTSTPRLSISGGSNGGLLVGAAMTQRPDLFGAAMPAVGVMDMLRFHRFTIGWAWVPDYGSSDNPEQFKALYAYSPLHNLKPGTKYPATLVTTADHDDRVVPAHSFKFTAALQAAQAGSAPVLIRIETKAGHGGGKPVAKIIEEISDKYAFLLHALGVKDVRISD